MAKLFEEIFHQGGSGDVILQLQNVSDDPHVEGEILRLRCHSLILTQHPYFYKMLGSCASEGLTREIHITEPIDEFVELIKFVYTNQLDMERVNVVGLLSLADKYCIDDVVDLCLKHIKEHFDADMFFNFCSFTALNSTYFEKLKEQLMCALHQRRNLCYITEDERWSELPVALVEAILSRDDLPITSEAEVLSLIAQWLGPHRRSKRDVARLLGAFRKSESTMVRAADVEALMESVGIDMFSSKEPRHGSAVWDPLFAVSRHEAASAAAVPIGGAAPAAEIDNEQTVHQLGPKDVLQQEPGWVHPGVHRCQVTLTCTSWAHRERRLMRSSPKLQSRAFDCSPSPTERTSRMTGHERSPSPPPAFQVRMPPLALEALETFDIANMSDAGSEQGGLGPGVIRNLSQDKVDNELVVHHIVCGVFSGVQRHGIRLSQRERNAIFRVEDLNGVQSLNIGGTMYSVSFDLELMIGEATKCGISRCRFALLRNRHVLMEEWFDVSSKVPIRFYFSSHYFDKNASYNVHVKWLRSFEKQPQKGQSPWHHVATPTVEQELQVEHRQAEVAHHFIGH